MSALSSALFDLPRPIARIVHIGAGDGGDLSTYLEAGAAAVLLVEAEEEAANRLRGLASRHANVQMRHAAVSGDTRPRPFHRLSFDDLSSLRPPEGMGVMFPGLQILSQDEVTPVDPSALLRTPEPDAEGSRLLVLETPGESAGILQSLSASRLLARFDTICLREPREPLYKGAEPLERIREQLEEMGFSVALEGAPEDPDRPWLVARRQSGAPELEEAQGRLTEATRQIKALETKVADLEKALGAAEDTEQRIRDSRDEMMKAEGQIRLLRDLLLDRARP